MVDEDTFHFQPYTTNKKNSQSVLIMCHNYKEKEEGDANHHKVKEQLNFSHLPD